MNITKEMLMQALKLSYKIAPLTLIAASIFIFNLILLLILLIVYTSIEIINAINLNEGESAYSDIIYSIIAVISYIIFMSYMLFISLNSVEGLFHRLRYRIIRDKINLFEEYLDDNGYYRNNINLNGLPALQNAPGLIDLYVEWEVGRLIFK